MQGKKKYLMYVCGSDTDRTKEAEITKQIAYVHPKGSNDHMREDGGGLGRKRCQGQADLTTLV